jgi:LysM repeat protein
MSLNHPSDRDPSRNRQNRIEELFALVVERTEAGKPIDDILIQCSNDLRLELEALLMTTDRLSDLRNQPVIPRSPTQRQIARKQFLNEALRQRMFAGANQAALPKTAVEEGGNWILDLLRSVLLPQSRRWAPVFAVSAVFVLCFAGLIGVAQAAVPGDLTYPVKTIVRTIELSLAPASRRPEVIKSQEDELTNDIATAAGRSSEVIEVTRQLPYYGRYTGRLEIGGLVVIDRYLTDANDPQSLRQIEIIGDPKPGDMVELTFRIIPGNPNVVEGVSIAALTAPPAQELPATATPTLVPQTQVCVPYKPDGWVSYRVQPGDTLGQIAVDGQSQVQELKRVNCLASEIVVLGSRLFVRVAPVHKSPAVAPVVPTKVIQYVAPTATIVAPSATPTTANTPEGIPTDAPIVPGGEVTVTTPISATDDANQQGSGKDEPTKTPTLVIAPVITATTVTTGTTGSGENNGNSATGTATPLTPQATSVFTGTAPSESTPAPGVTPTGDQTSAITETPPPSTTPSPTVTDTPTGQAPPGLPTAQATPPTPAPTATTSPATDATPSSSLPAEPTATTQLEGSSAGGNPTPTAQTLPTPPPTDTAPEATSEAPAPTEQAAASSLADDTPPPAPIDPPVSTAAPDLPADE